MKIVILNSSAFPIYEQIKDQVKEAIFAGELQEGEALPSIRQLAKDLKISVITTTRAYSDLEQEGFITTVQGKGCFVLPKNMELIRERALYDIEQGLTAAVRAAKNAQITRDEFSEVLDMVSREEKYE